jgi:hypothetical protein
VISAPVEAAGWLAPVLGAVDAAPEHALSASMATSPIPARPRLV